MTKSNTPYLDVSFADAEGTMRLKVRKDKPWFRTLASLPLRSFVSLRGQWAREGFGKIALAAYSSPLDATCNSVRSQKVLNRIISEHKLNLFLS